MLDIAEELAARGGKRSDTGISAKIWCKIVDDEELDDVLKVDDELPVRPTSLEVEKHLEVLQQLTLLGWEGNQMNKFVENANTYAQSKTMKPIKQKIITLNSLERWTWSDFISSKQ